MSLAMYASDYNNAENSNNNPIQKKRDNISRHNKTLKRKEGFKSNPNPNPKMAELVKKIHDDEEDGDEDDLSHYQPIQNPSSAGAERMDNSNMEDIMESQQMDNKPYSQSVQENFTQLPSEYAKQYYQQYVPYYNQSSDDNTPNGVNKDELLTKLNQIIYLLEEQQDENTGHVTEELILYSFLGIFMIFIVDSFARVGKYVR
jgi:hypothetical protein